MPQVMCPNCGMTINLENRKEIDVNLIKNAAKNRPRTFTELLRITRLPRKTLSFRLKELCATGVIVKKKGVYEVNGGGSQFVRDARKSTEKLSKMLYDRRVRTGLMFVALLLSFSVSGYVLAMLFTPPQSAEKFQEPAIIGNIAVTLDVNNVKNLYAWQAIITYNSSESKVIEIIPGKFLGVEYPFFLNASDIFENVLLLGGSLYGETPAGSGSGRLATIIFGYFVDGYEEPKIVLSEKHLKTYLLDSEGSVIPMGNPTTLTLTIIENPEMLP
jgi:hypothetical protein